MTAVESRYFLRINGHPHKGRVFIIIVNEFSWESTFGRMGYRYRDFSMLFFGIAAILWGSVMIVDGLLGVARRMVKGK
jgi:hypothetical protein